MSIPSDVLARTKGDVPELIATLVWTHTSEASRRNLSTIADMRDAPMVVRRVVMYQAKLSRMPTEEEWAEATRIVGRRVRERRAMVGMDPMHAAEAQADGWPE